MKPFLFMFVACTAVLAFAQAEPGAADALAEPTVELSMDEDVRSKIQEFLNEKRWTWGKNIKADGSEFFVSVGYGTIAAPPSHPSYNASRPRAFAKAMLAAKAQMARYLEQTLSDEVESWYSEPNQGPRGEPTPQEQMAAALSAMPDDSLIGKGKRYLHAKMDNLLAKEGVDISALRENAQADYAAAAAKAKQLVSTETFKRAIGVTAASYIAGIQAFYTVEGRGLGKNGEIGVVCICSDDLAETAASLTTGEVPPASRKGKKPIREQIPSDTNTLLTTFGVQQKIDENGQFVLVSYAQDAARSPNTRAVQAAYDKAQAVASAQIRDFAGEAVAINETRDEAEESSDYNVKGQLPDYSDESAYLQYQKSVAKALAVNGIKVIKSWNAMHPISGQMVYGVICAWSPKEAAFARQLKSSIEASARDGAEGRRTVGSSGTAAAGQGGATSMRKINKDAESRTWLNSGDMGDEDAF